MILYANDIVEKMTYCKLALYADNTVLYSANSKLKSTERKMREDMQALSSWCALNGIKMNTDKTKLMWFGNAKKLKEVPNLEISIEGRPIQTVSSYRYLGVTLDGQLNFASI